MRTFSFYVIFLMLATSVGAQEVQRPDPENPVNENLEVPAGWHVVLDRPDSDVTVSSDKEQAGIWFVNMVPGWHITTGPRAIFYHPASTADGNYRAETALHLFDPHGRNEAFGLFFGGQNLDGESRSYSYFLLRNSGEYLVKKWIGSETETVINWTPSDAVNRYTDKTGSSVKNALSVEVNDDQILFFINGQQVDALPRSTLQTDGIVGLRVNHHLNLHVEDLNVEDN